MSMRSALLLLVIAGACFSCQWGVPHNQTKPAITKDTLQYTNKTISETEPGCDAQKDSSCANASIQYVVFANQKALNDTIVKRLLGANYKGEPDSILEQRAKVFVDAYANAHGAKTPGAEYSFEPSANVIRQDSSLVTLQIDWYNNNGGAHGDEATHFINWDSKRGKEITLDDIFITGFNDTLTSIAEKLFRKQEKLNDHGSLENYFFKNKVFALNNNFLITPVGIRFLYNTNEIKPYMAGQTELLISYTEIKALLRPNTVISQYIK